MSAIQTTPLPQNPEADDGAQSNSGGAKPGAAPANSGSSDKSDEQRPDQKDVEPGSDAAADDEALGV